MTEQPCWVLCTPRTGSSYLCELLNNTNLFPKYENHKLKDVKGPIQRGMAFNEWLRVFDSHADFKINPPPCCKAIYHQYLEVMGEIPASKRYRPGFYFDYYDLQSYNWIVEKFNENYISAVLPNIKFMLLRRKNLFAHATSLYLARQTKKYHIYEERVLEEYNNLKVMLNKPLLMGCFQDAQKYYKLWDSFLTQPPLEIDYDDLAVPHSLLDRIADFLGVTIDAQEAIDRTNREKRIYKMTHPEAKFCEATLRSMVVKML